MRERLKTKVRIGEPSAHTRLARRSVPIHEDDIKYTFKHVPGTDPGKVVNRLANCGGIRNTSSGMPYADPDKLLAVAEEVLRYAHPDQQPYIYKIQMCARALKKEKSYYYRDILMNDITLSLAGLKDHLCLMAVRRSRVRMVYARVFLLINKLNFLTLPIRRLTI